MTNPDFFDIARNELARARTKFGPVHSTHEAYAVLLEEVDELWDAVRHETVAANPAAFLMECVQVAAMAGRFAEDLGLLEGRS